MLCLRAVVQYLCCRFEPVCENMSVSEQLCDHVVFPDAAVVCCVVCWCVPVHAKEADEMWVRCEAAVACLFPFIL